jgi:hypothetical protein
LVTVSDLINSEGVRPAISQTCYDMRLGDTNRYASMAKGLEAVYDAFDAKYGSRACDRPIKDPLRIDPSRLAVRSMNGPGHIPEAMRGTRFDVAVRRSVFS